MPSQRQQVAAVTCFARISFVLTRFVERQANGRSVAIVDVLNRAISAAREVGYLADLPIWCLRMMSICHETDCRCLHGTQGEPRAAMARIAASHESISEAGDTVIYSRGKYRAMKMP